MHAQSAPYNAVSHARTPLLVVRLRAGTVYKVQRLADGGVYAMKETDLGRQGPKERSDAVNEIRLLGSLAHPNVVRHHETFLSGNKLCIVMVRPAGSSGTLLTTADSCHTQHSIRFTHACRPCRLPHQEYAPAGDLASFIRAAAASKLPLPEAVVWQIFLQLCQGMQVRVCAWLQHQQSCAAAQRP